MPCRNEAGFIGDCLESIIENGYPVEALEVLVVDGMSTDGSRAIIGEYVKRHPQVRCIDNPRYTTPIALNIAIQVASGAYVLWMSAHNTYQPGYIQQCINHALTHGADNVGGRIVAVPRDPGFLGDAIVASLRHPFGVGGSAFRLMPKTALWVDTVFGGCYRRDVFDRIGLFNEALDRGQDMEFNLRLKRAGMRTLLVPGITSIYHARSRPWEFLRYNFDNGVWAIMPFAYTDGMPVGVRHLVPMVFVSFLLLGCLAALFTPVQWPLVATIAAYMVGALTAAVHIAVTRRDWRFALVMPSVFGGLHLSYGLGSLWGVVRVGALAVYRRVGGGTRPRTGERDNHGSSAAT